MAEDQVQTRLCGKIEPIIKKEVPYSEAMLIVEEIKALLSDAATKIEICGSLRRRKTIVHDCDLVIQKDYAGIEYLLMKLPKEATILRKGPKIISMVYNGVQVDIYIADENTFECTKLIRTGSANFNKNLCMIARQKGMSLKVSGEGLYKGTELVANTEESILKELLGAYKVPEERD